MAENLINRSVGRTVEGEVTAAMSKEADVTHRSQEGGKLGQ